MVLYSIRTVFYILLFGCSWFTVGPVGAEEPLQGRAETNWRYGDERSILMTEFWVPVSQGEDNVLYGDLRIMGDDQSNREGNVGIGYREIVPEWAAVVGGNVWFDRRITELSSNFNQLTFGGEWLGEDFDVRVNGYVPLSSEEFHSAPNPNAGGPTLVGSQIIVDTNGILREEPQGGFDLELGWQVPFFEDHTDSVRVYGGGFYFSGDQSEDVAGWRTRVAADITSDVQVGARFQSDDVRGSQGFLEATIRFPFGNKISYRKEGLRARLDESPERDIDIVTGTKVTDGGERQTVLNAVTGQPQEVFHVDNTVPAGGDGSVETPFDTLGAAEIAAGIHDIIYVHTGDGANTNQDQGITLDKVGQQLIGAGTSFVFDRGRFTTASGEAPAPANGIILTATGAPIINNVNATSDGITVNADDVKIAGITVDGATRDGIVVEADGGGASAQNVLITDVTAINNRMGIYVHGVNGGSVSASVQRSITTANAQHGIAVYDDMSATFTADLGGGAMGSVGRNILAGNTLEDLAVEYDGGTLSAMNNWWGQASGPDNDDPSIGIAPQIYYGAPINDGLVGHWTFDTEWLNGVTAYDRSGNGNDGTLLGQQGLPTATAGSLGEALDFSGDPDGNGGLEGDYVTVPNAPAFHVTPEVTVIAREKRPIGQGFGTLVRTRSDYFIETSGTSVRFGVDAQFNSNTTLAGTLADDAGWHQVAGSYEGNLIRRYIDGAFINQTAYVDVLDTNNGPLRIGTRNDAFADYFTGQIDDVRIYSRALSAPEIAELNRMDGSSAVNITGFLGAAP